MTDRGIKKKLTGTVVSNRMDKTAVVMVERLTRHPLYGKYFRRHSRFFAHDPDNGCAIGDQVRIIESRPLSRLKRWRVLEIVKKAAQEVQ
ncbi:MAG: 30S ribosomal protein S17 [Deltaproteobacteria bacterium CG_4_8_14_3_um_filter_51_11]|nr:30S ribosomal protein S17 [bacterium]OIP39422.1 MAG: 30S ribosomal protein S17 [Desulfobacteraceae bacterium CG2_30_51_40]PIP45301.1 MAG: 30S ribosomal protein S17 [Deltaproteobacteria bacterium CG23_combo_of_CG06-09_8_20_14_all_51_20]PIW02156.1 MAG: 30S ribosomal protein S17 [Deltaproteobacteria bacterium CG17_big_fil_post_rev_8_21_14_2_50_51_6]PIX21051.1 MAG: 30S ribosomal protein S17 [Deltaproteobacteria bacterium CG_4_8_14_3_um_filter_51_11]PIY22934.1 MAG: 30S ribosomal protein S17 [Del